MIKLAIALILSYAAAGIALLLALKEMRAAKKQKKEVLTNG